MYVLSMLIAMLGSLQEDTNWRAGWYLAWDAKHAEIIVARTGDIHRELDVSVLRDSMRRKIGRSTHVVQQELTLDNQEYRQLITLCLDQDAALMLKIKAMLADWKNPQVDIEHFTRATEDINVKLHQSHLDSSDAREFIVKVGAESSFEDLDSKVRTSLYRKLDRLSSQKKVELPNDGAILLDELQGVNSIIARYSELQDTPEHTAILARLVELRREILRLDGASATSNLRILK